MRDPIRYDVPYEGSSSRQLPFRPCMGSSVVVQGKIVKS